MRIEGKGFALRDWEMSDCRSLVRNADNINIWNNLRDGFPHPYTAQDAEAFISLAREKHRGGYLAIEVGGLAAGGVGITRGSDVERLNAEIGYWLGEEYWGRGIASGAVRLFSEHVFSNTDIIRLFAGVYDYNTASQRVLEKAGYTRLATMRRAAVKNGKIIDLEYYELVKPYVHSSE